MRLAIDTGLFPYQSWEETFELIAESGIKYVEWSQRGDFVFQDVEEKELLRVGKLIERAGLELAGMIPMCPLASPIEAERHKAVADWKRLIAITASLGARQMFGEMTGNALFKKEVLLCTDAFKRSMEALAPTLAEAGMHASFEPHPGDFVEENNKAVDLIREMGHREVGYLFCMPHTYVMTPSDTRQTAVEMIQYAGKTITHTHIADTHPVWRIITMGGAGAHEHMLPGWGELDFPAIAQALREVGYDGFVSAPLFSHADRDGRVVLKAAITMREYAVNTLGIALRGKGAA
ncbi:MAG: sugar phosphate isomerase/epimerase [Candidatus Hydrogenedentes bacterium]|nr:sugar phosphate isomerase/epimerase [Candidatus Hydrogenedentota bacterium]